MSTLTESLFSLPVQKSLTESIHFCQYGQLPILIIKHAKCRAALSLQGGQLLYWQPTGHEPVIWLSEKTAFNTGVAIRGGVPVCWPWFGKTASPSHGFARNILWTSLSDFAETNEDITVSMTISDNEETRKTWPHAFTLKAEFILGNTCQISLESSGDYEATAALHSYFHIGNIDNIAITGLGGHYLDKIEGTSHTGAPEVITIHSETDRIFTTPEPATYIHDPLLKRTIIVQHENNSDVVLWNPGQAGSINMADMPDDGYKNMVCVETARLNVPISPQNEDNTSRISTLIRCERHH